MIIDVASTDVVAVYRALVGRRDPPADRLGHDGRRARPGQPRAVQLLQRLRRQSAGRRLLARPCAATAPRKTRCSTLKPSPEFVLNAAVEDLAEQMNATAKELPPGQSEAEYAGLALEPSTKVRPPRVAESPVHLECRVRQIMPDRRRPDRGQPGDRRGAPDSHRRLRARCLLAASIRASCARSPAWGATTTAGAPTCSRWSGREPHRTVAGSKLGMCDDTNCKPAFSRVVQTAQSIV